MQLASAWAKWSRGEIHRHNFVELEQQYAAAIGDPAIALTGPDGWTEYRRRELPDPPQEVSLVLGDGLQAYRSALEHAVYELSKLGDPRFEGTEFPITLDAKDFEKRRPRLRHLPSAHQAFIERLQPYALPTREPRLSVFWQLHDLARVDRHRTIPLTTAVTFPQSVITQTVLTDEVQRSEVEWVFDDDGGTRPGALLLRIPPSNPGMVTRPNWDVIIALPSSAQWLQPILSAASGLVAAVIGELEADDPTWPPRGLPAAGAAR